jgi:hypothetical protein
MILSSSRLVALALLPFGAFLVTEVTRGPTAPPGPVTNRELRAIPPCLTTRPALPEASPFPCPSSAFVPSLKVANFIANFVVAPQMRAMASGGPEDYARTFTADPLYCFETWPPDIERVTVYFDEFAIDFPRRDLRGFPNLRSVRLGCGAMMPDQSCLATMPGRQILHGALADGLNEIRLGFSIDRLDRWCPGFTRWFWDELEARLTFASDFELLRKVYSHDYTYVGRAFPLQRMGAIDYFEHSILAGVKSMSLIVGYEHGLRIVHTPCCDGILWGSFDAPRGHVAQLFIQDADLTVVLAPSRKGPKEPPWLRENLGAVLASIRYHYSPTPGADMLAEARRVLANPVGDNTAEIACVLALHASRYEDAYEESVTFPESLIPDDWSDDRVALFCEILLRQNERYRHY